jgi:hypothetical protein
LSPAFGLSVRAVADLAGSRTCGRPPGSAFDRALEQRSPPASRAQRIVTREVHGAGMRRIKPDAADVVAGLRRETRLARLDDPGLVRAMGGCVTEIRVAIFSNYPPRVCGIGSFAFDLRTALVEVEGIESVGALVVVDEPMGQQRLAVMRKPRTLPLQAHACRPRSLT